MKNLLTTIVFLLLFLVGADGQSRLLIDDFTTGKLEKVTISDRSAQRFLQAGRKIIKGSGQRIGHRLVFARVNQNPFGQNAQINIEKGLMVMSFAYDTKGTVYVNYGVDKKGNAPMNLNLKKYKSIKIEFDAKSTVNGINLNLFTGTTYAAYGGSVKAREGRFVYTIPFSKIKATGSKFAFSDIDYIRFQFDSRSKTGCNMAINKIWFE